MKTIQTANQSVAEVIFECEPHWDGSYSLSEADVASVEALGAVSSEAELEPEFFEIVCREFTLQQALDSCDPVVQEWLDAKELYLGFLPPYLVVEKEAIGAELDLLRLQGWRTREELEREFLFGVLSGGESRGTR